MVLIVTIFTIEITSAIIVTLCTSLVILTSSSLRSTYIHTLIALLFLSHTFYLSASIGHVSTRIFSTNSDNHLKTGITLTRDLFYGFIISFTTLVSGVRFISVYKLFIYQTLTRKHGILAILSNTLLIIVFTVWRLFSTNAYIVFFLITNIGAFILLISNTWLYRSVKRQCYQIAATIVAPTRQEQEKQRNNTRRRSLKALKMCVWILASYFITILPGTLYYFVVRAFLNHEYPDDYSQLLERPSARLYMDSIVTLFGISNSFWDTIIFYKFNSEARVRAMRLFRRLVRSTNVLSAEPVQSGTNTSIV